jgi:hypothetical protein
MITTFYEVPAYATCMITDEKRARPFAVIMHVA